MIDFVKMASGFMSSKFNVALVAFLVALGLVSFFFVGGDSPMGIDEPHAPVNFTDEINPENVTLHLFYTPTCPYCKQQMPIAQEIASEMPGVSLVLHDASTYSGSMLFHEMSQRAGLDTSRLGVPTTFVGRKAIVGLHSKEQILETISECITECKAGVEVSETDGIQKAETKISDFDVPLLGKVDLTQLSLPALAVLLGLVDGFNPCALWVLIFMITLLINEKSKAKIWLVAGSFVFASAVSYFLFMTAWLNLFLLIGYIRIITLLIGLFAIGAGILNLKEYVESKGQLVCKVGDEDGKEKTMGRIQKIISQPITIGVILAVVALAFSVNAIEFVCSAAIPAIFTQVLALSAISSVEHYLYISLYVFFYMLDHIIIFGMAAFAIGSGATQKYAKWCKLLGGGIMLLLGIMMVFAPHLLS